MRTILFWEQKLLLICLVLFSNIRGLRAQNWVLSQLLPIGYNKLQVPLIDNLSNDTISVNASITLNSFNVIEKSQTVVADMFLCLNWTDYRLQVLNFKPNSVSGLNISSDLHLLQVKLSRFDSLWRPIVYFRNSLATTAVSPLHGIEYLQIWPDSKMLQFCSRMSVIFICRMKFTNFPFDEHYCHFELENFEKEAQKLNIQMLRVSGVKGNSKFRVRNTFTGICDPISYSPNKMSEGTNANVTLRSGYCAYGGIRLVRNLSYYIIRWYLPTFLMVMMGYAGFWIPTNAWPARIILTASVLLTLIATSLQGYNEVPANEMVSLYWWLWVCQFLMYMSMLEYVLALSWANLITDKKINKTEDKKFSDGYYFGQNGWFAVCGVHIGKCIRMIFGHTDHYRDPENRNKVDYFARILFPLILIVFVFVYIVATLPDWANKWRW